VRGGLRAYGRAGDPVDSPARINREPTIKIAYFTESLYPHVDGVSRTLARLFATLEERGVDFRVFSPFVPDESVSWARRVRPLRYVRFPLYPDYRIAIPRLTRGVRAELYAFSPDLVHVVSPTPAAVWAQRWAKRAGVPVVASFHTHFVSYFRYYGVRAFEGLGWSVLRRFYARCERVYAPSVSIIRELERRGIERVELWSRGIDLSGFSPEHRSRSVRDLAGADDSTPLLLLVSRLVKEKDLADLVDVDRALRARGVRFRLALVGGGPMKRELRRRLPDAHFAGHLTGEELGRWYASADVFVFPSTTETLGNVVLEALASGLPAVVVDRGGPQDLIDPGVTGFVARANDIESMADALEKLLTDAPLRARMSEAARKSAGSRDWSEINGALIRSYHEVVEGFRMPAPATGEGEVERFR
jgi:phosphatidylinositol alpha 1,6-mannosyltransferase